MRHAIRSLLKAPGFSLVVCGIVAIAIGACTAVFSVVDAVLLQPLPYREPSRLFVLAGSNPKRAMTDAPFSYPAFAELASRDRLLEGLAAIANENFNATGSDYPEQLRGARVSATFFKVLGLDVAAGRRFTAGEDETGARNVVILGRGYWRRRFGGRQTAIGATMTLNGESYDVVGALGIELPPPFDGVDVWAPGVDRVSGFPRTLIQGGIGYLTAVARVPLAANLTVVQSEIDTIAHAYARANPGNTDADPDASLRLAPLEDGAAGGVRRPLLIVLGAVGLVLLIACANVANLWLVRATARSHEAAVRLALGATRLDLVRWLCGESLVLSLAGGAAGVLLAFWSVQLMSATLLDLPRGSDIAVNGRVVVFASALSILVGVLFGIFPAVHAASLPPAAALKSGGGRTTTARRGPRYALVTVEIALSFMLLVGAGLLLRSFTALTHVAVGFEAERVLTFQLSLPTSTYADAPALRSFFTRLMPKLQAAPGVAAAAASMALPPTIAAMAPYVTRDQPMIGIGERPLGEWSAVTPEYFSTLAIPIVAGRTFNGADTDESPLVVIVSQGLARRAWPGTSPIGRRILVGRFPDFAEVVGVAADVKNNGLAREPMPEMYTPYAQRPWPAMQVAVRAAAGQPADLVNTVRAAMRQVDPQLPMTAVATMDARLSHSIATERLITRLLLAFGMVALILAAAGLYAVIGFTVARRTSEIGIRVALGAPSRKIVWLVASEGLRLLAAGATLGGVAALIVSRTMRSLLYGVSPADPATYLGVLAILAAAACAALVVPTRRALAVPPQIALRSE